MRTLLALALFFLPALHAAEPACFELRTYHAAEGKLDATTFRQLLSVYQKQQPSTK